MDPEALAWLQLALTPGLSARAAARAVEAAGGPRGAARWPPERLAAAAGARPGTLPRRPADVDPTPVLSRCSALGVVVLTPCDPRWPRTRFQALADPPAALFLAGRLGPPDRPSVALVGTRRASAYGLRVAAELGEGLARRGVCVVSGLAAGIDAAAHAGALRAPTPPEAPPTLAVLGNGTAVAYPPENAALRDDLVERAGLLSEHAPDVGPERWHFPRRNRLVAALADVLVVVEAPLRSGALLTAALALDAGREVLAVPGPVDRLTHEGVHELLKRGAAGLCRGLSDVLACLGLPAGGAGAPPERPALPDPPPGPLLELFRLLDPDDALTADALCLRTGLPPDAVAVALAQLELDGRARRVPGVGYLRC